MSDGAKQVVTVICGWVYGWLSGLVLGGSARCLTEASACELGVSRGAGVLGWLGPLLVYGMFVAVGVLLVKSLYETLADPELDRRSLALGAAVGGAIGAGAGWLS